MEEVKLVERMMIQPETPTPRRRIFLSNIDLTLVAYQESVSFFDPPANQMSFSEACRRISRGISRLLVTYDFMAGRLEEASSRRRLEIDCNSAGFVLATATTKTRLSQLGELAAPKPEFRQLVAFLREENEDELELKDKPLGLFQLTEFACGGLALGSRYNHCALDGVSVHQFNTNLASLTRGEALAVLPTPDRTIFRARNPPQITHPHFEYSKATDTDNSFTLRGTSTVLIDTPQPYNQIHALHLSAEDIQALKKAALKDGKLKNCTAFQAVAAKIWKARSIAVGMADDKISTMLFPVDTRTRIVPPAPAGFSGNALVPGFARATVRELKKGEEYSSLVRRVQEGIDRLDDEYIRSGIDWLEVNTGMPCREDSFSLVSWWRLGLETEEFAWGRLKCAAPVVVKPGIVFLLPAPTPTPTPDQGGLNIFLELQGDQQVEEFRRLMMAD